MRPVALTFISSLRVAPLARRDLFKFSHSLRYPHFFPIQSHSTSSTRAVVLPDSRYLTCSPLV